MLWGAEGSKAAWIRAGLPLGKINSGDYLKQITVGQLGDTIRKEMAGDDWELSVENHKDFQQCFAVV